MSQRLHLFDLSREELIDLVDDWGLPRYRADQILHWIYQQGAGDFAQMSNLAKTNRIALAQRLDVLQGSVVGHQQATDGTHKLLIDWSSGDLPTVLRTPSATTRQTECVMIPADPTATPSTLRRTACISSQVGCAVGCRFCASGIGGLDGNLSAGQIVQQVWHLARLDGVGRISHVVFMGMGEPLANYPQVIKAIKILTADWAMGISPRRITISTVGLPAQMRRLAELELPITLAISLHAPNDKTRRRLIPWARYVTIAQLIEAGKYYFQRTGREVTLEYVLLAGENDHDEHARELAGVAKQLRSNVNLIRYNQVAGLPFTQPRHEDVHRFAALLRRAGINTHVRASRGHDIAAACGQLRHEASGL